MMNFIFLKQNSCDDISINNETTCHYSLLCLYSFLSLYVMCILLFMILLFISEGAKVFRIHVDYDNMPMKEHITTQQPWLPLPSLVHS